MRVVLCATAKNEHLYINDWCKYYLKLGFDHIYLFDNDDKGSPKMQSYLDDAVKEYVTIYDIRGKREDSLQQHSYMEFYKNHLKEFDWCAFFDVDEYLDGVSDVKTWLEEIPEEFKQVRIKFRTFDDNDLIERDMSVPVYEALTRSIVTSFNNGMKSIVRGGIENIFIHSVHFSSYDGKRENVLKQCYPSGRSCGDFQINIDHESSYLGEHIFLNHYRSKTISEFIKQKLNRGDCVFAGKSPDFGYFFKTNKVTPEKLAYIKKKGFDYDPDKGKCDNIHKVNVKLPEFRRLSELDYWIAQTGKKRF